MPTALDIIQDSLEMLGVYGPGDTISSADQQRALSVLNDMMDLWSNESLACFTYDVVSFTLVSGVPQYTIGSGGVINVVRPLRVSDDPGSAYILDDNNNKYPMDVVGQMEWNLRTTASVNANLPDTLFYDPQYPMGLINIWPTPNEGWTCYFSTYAQLGDFSSLSTTFSLPPGYKRAITTNLAVCLKPYFTSAQLDPDVRAEAATSKGTVKRNNMRAQRAVYDPELIARGSPTYNIRSDRNGY